MDVVSLTQELVRLDTTEPKNNERKLLQRLQGLLEAGGFTCALHGYDPTNPDKVNLVAQLCPSSTEPALCFGGHIDIVPFGGVPWQTDPLEPTIVGDKMYGRGTCDMKGGMAAIVCAALNMAPRLKAGQNLIVHAYGSEELGLLGSRHLATQQVADMGKIGAVVIAEPSCNVPQVGHKGIVWAQFEAGGVTAHASMPELGENALAKLLPTANRLKDYNPNVQHEHLGVSTAVIATMHSGMNTNSVPDKAVLTMDVRIVAGQTNTDIMNAVSALADEGVKVSQTADIPVLWTDPENPWVKRVKGIVQSVTGVESGVECAIFATDGSTLRLALNDEPIVVLGPGDQRMAHRTDEFVPLQELHDAQSIYEKLIEDWYL